MRSSVKFQKDIPRLLMQNLLYPAIFGTVLVLFIYKVFQHTFCENIADISNWWGLWALIHFSLSYLANERWKSDYNWKTFLLDSMEIIIILFSFHFLGFSNIPASNPNYRFFYFTFLFSPIGQFLWTIFLSKDKMPRDLYFILPIRFAIYFVGMILNNRFCGFDASAIILSFALTIWYIESSILFE